MSVVRRCQSLFKSLVYADTLIPQEFTVTLPAPQQEIVVSLHGLGSPFDVTDSHTTACCAPMILGVSMEKSRCLPRRNHPPV